MLVYLAGAIEYAPDSGRGWRKEITPFLRCDLGYNVYDPAEDERKSLTAEEQKKLRLWKATDLSLFQAAVRKIIQFDLEMVSRVDCIVCYWDEYGAKGGGTSAELTFAHRRGIPVYLVTPLPLAEVSGWILACSTHIFDSFERLKQFLSGQSAVGSRQQDKLRP